MGQRTIFGRVAAAAGVLLTLGLAALAVGSARFARLVHRDVKALLAQARPAGMRIVTPEMLEGLPAPVRRYLTDTGIVGTPFVQTVHLKQAGWMQTGPGQPRLPLDAEQHYTVCPPGFVWSGTIRLGRLPLVRGRDMYAGGRGNMLIRAAGLFTIADATGAETDQAALTRYLSEMIWFPTAFLEDNVAFAALDERSVRVTLTDRGRSVSGTLFFDDEGRLTDFVTQRYRMVEGRFELDTWSAPATEYGERAGLKLPVRGQAVWKLPEGDLPYIDVRITSLAYDAQVCRDRSPRPVSQSA
jgi:hypothetical protein